MLWWGVMEGGPHTQTSGDYREDLVAPMQGGASIVHGDHVNLGLQGGYSTGGTLMGVQ